ncbi:MAG: glucosyl-3-phosphoglycerate synthase [Egibacteraceae bacterium]
MGCSRFAHRTYYADDLRIDDLAARKRAAGLRVSVVLPARNEAETIEAVVASVTQLSGTLVDEVVLLDGGSTDGTRERAEAAGATTYGDDEVRADLGPTLGKGDALWRSLSVTSGDLIVFIDTDIRNPDPKFVWGLLGPLLLDPKAQLVKGFYERPLKTGDTLHPTGGGRVTELTARPLLNLFWPELAWIAQPLSGEYAGRRALFESIPFFTGYGVEIGMLIDTLAIAGVDAIAQVDLGVRVHRNQSIDALARMAFGVAQVAMRRLAEAGRGPADAFPHRFVQFERRDDGRLEPKEQQVAIVERRPMRDFTLSV